MCLMQRQDGEFRRASYDVFLQIIPWIHGSPIGMAVIDFPVVCLCPGYLDAGNPACREARLSALREIDILFTSFR